MPSTVIRTFHFDAGRHELYVTFQSGKRYIYRNVPAAIYEGMKAAFGKGEFFNAHIRDRFEFVREDNADGEG